MRIIMLTLALLVSSVGARAQVEYIDPALKVTNLGVNLGRFIVEVKDHLERLKKLKQFADDLDHMLDDIASIKSEIAELKDLVRYSNLQLQTKANLSRLESFLRFCNSSVVDEFCEDELQNLMMSARTTSASARALEGNSIAFAMVAGTQELDLLLADVSESLVWSQVIESEYDAYWSSLLEKQNENSLTSKLSTLEAQQSRAIERGFGIKYDGGPIAEYEEFLEFKTWVESVGSRALATQNSMNCVVFDSTLGGALFGGVRAVDFIEAGENILRLDPVYTVAIHSGESVNNNTSIRQAPGLTTFEFIFDVKLKSATASRQAKYQDAMSIFTKRNCRLYAGDQGEIQNHMFQESAVLLEPLEIAINEPVFEMLKLRNEIKLAKAASQRLGGLG